MLIAHEIHWSVLRFLSPLAAPPPAYLSRMLPSAGFSPFRNRVVCSSV
ncbi:hypothetical protein [Rubritalea tangerina]